MRDLVRQLAVSVALAATVGVSAACGGSPKAGAAVDEKPLTKAELTKALLRNADVPGLTVDIGPGLPLFDPDDIVTASPTACQPIADTMSVRPRHARRAQVWESLDGVRGAAGTTSGGVVLSSHAEDDARAVVADLKKALPKCGHFSATSAAGWTYGFDIQQVPAPAVGDDAVSYLTTNTIAPDGKGNVESVVRTGSTLSAFLLPQGNGEPASVPEALARKQHERLRAIRG
ncbi:hypothetical protein ABZ883_26960 [Streptomyces sp. NPDC046977]|uniref:hypothetical protein n=1 Tax=Streptomyces sp. NPDC046977 TaxID=3154703 RepID=UPI00340D61D2